MPRLHGDGGPQAGEVTRLGGVTRLSLSNYNERLYRQVLYPT